MRKTISLLSIFAAGCVPSETLQVTANTPTTISGSSCEGPAASQCTFINSPVKLSKKEIILPGRKFPFFLTEQKLKFIDASHRQWEAPIKTLTDGASIPPALVGVVGNPRAKEFINAATIHDAYCATGNEKKSSYHTRPWQLVHRMFYDALLIGGVAPAKAKIMYAGVYLGGPRWGTVKKAQLTTGGGTQPIKANVIPASAYLGGPQWELVRNAKLTTGGSAQPIEAKIIYASAYLGGSQSDVIKNAQLTPDDGTQPIKASAQSTESTRAQQSNRPLAARGVSNARLVAAMKQAKAYIQSNNPSLNQLESYMTGLERSLLGTKSGLKTKTKKSTHQAEGGDGGGGGEGSF